MRNYKAFDVDSWADETLAKVEEAVKQARDDALRMTEENNKKWEARKALRGKLTAQYGELIGLLLYHANLEREAI